MNSTEACAIISSGKVSESQVQNMIGIILSDRTAYNTTLNYAVGYCNQARYLSGHDLQVQCLYILNNIIHWRHQFAKEVRTTLKLYSFQKEV